MLEKELKIARRLAAEAGEMVLGYFRSQAFDVEEKPNDAGPVTSADEAANTFLCDALRGAFPDDAILAEESVSDFSPAERVWLVDPIDGTREFIAGRDEFSVMIGLAMDGEPVLGVVHRPLPATTAWAVRGQGAFRESATGRETLQTSTTSETTELRLLRSRSHDSQRVSAIRDTLGITEQRRLGSYGLKVVEIASGRDDLYMTLSSKTALWDSAAAQVILHEAGGQITTTRGEPIRYVYTPESIHHHHGTCASNGPAHPRIIEVIQAQLAG